MLFIYRFQVNIITNLYTPFLDTANLLFSCDTAIKAMSGLSVEVSHPINIIACLAVSIGIYHEPGGLSNVTCTHSKGNY